MKKTYFIISLFLWSCAQTVNAQNVYRRYASNIVSRPTSAVSVVHSNGFVYFFQADNNGNLDVTEIDPLSMNPTGNAKYYQLTMQNVLFNLLSLNDVFEDAAGKFVLLGDIQYYDILQNEAHQHPAHIIITSDLSTCRVYYDINTIGSYTVGCDGNDQTMGETYVLLHGNKIVVVEPASPTNVYQLELNPNTNPNDYYTDISWDDAHNWFIATGEARDVFLGINDPFVEVFHLFNYSTITPIATYCVLNQSYSKASEYKSLHARIDDENLVLYNDLRRYNNPYQYDIIWLTRIRNYWNSITATIPDSWFYELANSKLLAKDMIYDPFNERIDLLGEFNKCIDGTIQLLTQVNPFNLCSGLKIGQLGAGFTGGSCPNDQLPSVNFGHNDLKMFNLTLNKFNPCWPVLIAGTGMKSSILTETYDISYLKCDKPMVHTDTKATPIIYPYTLYTSSPLQTNIQQYTISGINENILHGILCDVDDACSHQFDEKKSQHSLTNDLSTVSIVLEANHHFICNGFEDEIQYSLYDVAGKLLQQGITHNGEQNPLRMSNGIYLLKATDATGNQVVKKIVVL